MSRERWKAIVAVAAVVLLVVVGVASFLYLSGSTPTSATNDCSPPATAPETVAPGWESSYRAGCLDAAGNMMGGSELMHLVAHDGMLFAAVGYWEDTANIYYGGTNSSEGWGQILRLDAPNGRWAVDLTLTGRPRISTPCRPKRRSIQTE